jgi:hypothetical protein
MAINSEFSQYASMSHHLMSRHLFLHAGLGFNDLITEKQGLIISHKTMK